MITELAVSDTCILQPLSFTFILRVPEGTWRLSGMPFEGLCEGEGITVTDLVCDILDGEIRFKQESGGNLHTVDQQIFLQGISGGIFKQPRQITTIQTTGKGDVLDFDWFCIFQLDI